MHHHISRSRERVVLFLVSFVGLRAHFSLRKNVGTMFCVSLFENYFELCRKVREIHFCILSYGATCRSTCRETLLIGE